MTKIKVSLLSLMLVAGATAEAKVYLGAGVGYARSNANVTTTTSPRSSAKVKPGASGAILDVHVGSVDHLDPKLFVFEQIAIQFDTVKAKKNTPKLANTPAQQKVDRLYNIAASVGLGYKLAPTWDVYGKIGIANAAIRLSHKDVDQKISPVTNTWGGLIGFGVNKIFESHAVGLDYEYTRYQATKFSYVNGGTGATYSTKLKNTAYHAVMVKFSKSF